MIRGVSMRRFDNFRRSRNEQDKLLAKICIYAFILLAALILFEKVIGNLPNIGSSIAKATNYLNTLTAPFLMGFAIAYVMNPFLNFFEKVFKKSGAFFQNHVKITRILSILINYVIIIGGTVWIVIYLVPEVRDSIITFATNVTAYSDAMNVRIQNFFDRIVYINSADVNNVINRLLAPVKDISQNAPELLETIAVNVYGFGRITIQFIMAIFIAFYMLLDKERFSLKAKKGIYTFFPKEKADVILRSAIRTHHIFQNFIVGKAVDSLIIGILAFIGLNLMKAPYPLILSLIIGVTNMIPYFGPFIGAVPSFIIIVLQNPIQGLYFLIFIVVLQQIDGNIIGPKILGSSTGLSAFWVVFAILVFGGLWGFPGMLLGVPLMAVIYYVAQKTVSYFLKKRGLTTDTLAYVYLTKVDKESNQPVYDKNPSKKELKKHHGKHIGESVEESKKEE